MSGSSELQSHVAILEEIARSTKDSLLRIEHRLEAVDAGLRAEITGLRGEIRTGLSDVRGEIKDVRGEIRTGLADVRGEIKDVRSAAQSDFKWLLSLMLGGFGSLLAIMARGFGWLHL